MIIKVVKNKNFWFGWLVLSCIGGFIGYILNQRLEENFSNDKIAYVREFREEVKKSSIIVVENKSDTLDYIKYFEKQTGKVNFQFVGLPEGTKVYVLRVSSDEHLVKIAVKWDKKEKIYGSYAEYWIWYEFVSPVNIPPRN